MIDIKTLRDDPQGVKENCRRRGCQVDIDELFELDRQFLSLTREVEGPVALVARQGGQSIVCPDGPAGNGAEKRFVPMDSL